MTGVLFARTANTQRLLMSKEGETRTERPWEVSSVLCRGECLAMAAFSCACILILSTPRGDARPEGPPGITSLPAGRGERRPEDKTHKQRDNGPYQADCLGRPTNGRRGCYPGDSEGWDSGVRDGISHVAYRPSPHLDSADLLLGAERDVTPRSSSDPPAARAAWDGPRMGVGVSCRVCSSRGAASNIFTATLHHEGNFLGTCHSCDAREERNVRRVAAARQHWPVVSLAAYAVGQPHSSAMYAAEPL